MSFPVTRPSLIDELRATDRDRQTRALRKITELYWKPVYLFVRRRFRVPPSEAEDVVQSFFAEILDSDKLQRYEPGRAKFRTYLRQALVNFAIDEHRARTAKKRHGEHVDVGDAENELASASPGLDPQEAFERDWIQHVMRVCVERLKERLTKKKKDRHLAVFQRFHLADQEPTYAEVAAELGIKVTDVTNSLHAARRELRLIALELLASVTSSREEMVEEAREIFGAEI